MDDRSSLTRFALWALRLMTMALPQQLKSSWELDRLSRNQAHL
jgi:hypothetical protein